MNSTQRTAPQWLAVWMLLLAFSLSGCATSIATSSKKVPAEVRKVYVQTVEGDGYNVDQAIARQLQAMGYTTEVGAAAKPKEPVDVTLTYDDQWSWDMYMYLMKLTIKIRDGRSGKLITAGEIHSTSRTGRSPDEMARDLLEDLFARPGGKSAPKPGGE